MDYRSRSSRFNAWYRRKVRRLAWVRKIHNALWGKSYRAVVAWSTLICLILAVGVGVATIYARLVWDDKLEHQLSTLQNAVEKNDIDAAAAALQELVSLQPENKRYAYRLALADSQRGRDTEALQRMQQLVIAEDPFAALWIAEHEHEHSGFKTWSEKARAEYYALLKLAIQVNEENSFIRAKNLLSTYLLELGEWAEAVEHLVELAPYKPESKLHAALLCELHGDHSHSEQYARDAQIYFKYELDQRPQDIVTRLNLARSMMLLAQEKDALHLLSEGYELTQQSTLQQAAGEVLVAWARRLAKKDAPSTAVSRVQLIHRATQCAPADTSVVTALLRLVNECLLNPEAYVSYFQKAAAAGGDHESLHFMLGILAIDRNDREAATQHLELARQAGTHVPTVLNNLAIAILQNGDADRALLYADVANELLPNQPHLCDVRGRILLKLNRCEEAIPDLQIGLTADELKPLVLPNLRIAYQSTGRFAEADKLKAEGRY